MIKKFYNIFDRIWFWILIILLILIPFNAFLATFLPNFLWNFEINFFQNFSKLFLIWKEILLLILSFLFLWKWIKNKKFPIQKFFLFDKIFLWFFLIAVWVTIFSFSEKNIVQNFFWFRLDFIYFLFFYLIRWFDFSFWWWEVGFAKNIKKLFYFFIWSWLISLIFWFSLYSQSFNWVPEKIITSKNNFINLSEENKKFIKKFYEKKDEKSDILIKKDFLINWDEKQKIENNLILKNFFENPDLINFRNENFLNKMVDLWYSAWVSNYEVNKSLPAFHIVEAKWTARFASTFAWPNQLWFFLMVFIWIILWYLKFLFKNFWNKKEKIFLIWTLIFALISLYFTFSRSAWLWVLLIFWLFTFFSFPKKYRSKIFFWWIFWWIILIFYTYFFQQDFFERTVLRWWSTAMHFERTINWIQEVKENPMWLWLWMAWPVTMRFDWEAKIAENWFVQMFQEFWILWWVFYLFFIWSFLKFLITSFVKNNFQNFVLFWGFLGLSGILFAGLFLHSFEDIWVSLLLFLFLGVWLFDINKKNL